MKIGVILREVNDRYTLNKELADVISFYGGTCIGLVSYEEDILSSLDGLILQGGSDYTIEDLKILKYFYDQDKPVLGICLGMQTMGILFGGNLEILKTEEHYVFDKNDVHEVKIDTNSKFYDIIKKDKVSVNSRHHEALSTTELDIVGISSDSVIEVIEDKDKKFFLGVQWHPETNFTNDLISQKIFQAFFNTLSR